MRLDPLPTELRPVPALMKYYAISSLVAGPFFVFPLLVLFFRYRTLHYRIDPEGVTMRWGALFRREVSLNYARVQDIHLSSNVLERWLGLGKIQLQTASASSKAELTMEGVPDLEAMRDFLYGRMRGATSDREAGEVGDTGRGALPGSGAPVRRPAVTAGPDAADGELAGLLRDVAAEVRALRQDLQRRDGGGSHG